MTKKIFWVKNFFPLIWPKKLCLITQNQFWPFLGVLSGFLGVPRTLNFGGLSLYFDNSLREKRSEVERPRETACLTYPLISSPPDLIYANYEPSFINLFNRIKGD